MTKPYVFEKWSMAAAALPAVICTNLFLCAQPAGAGEGKIISTVESGEKSQVKGEESSSSQFRAVIVARDRAVLSAEMAGRIISIPFNVGDIFKKGDILANFDCKLLEFNRTKAEKDEQGAKRKWESVSKLEKLSATGRLNVDLSYVDFKKAEAEHNSAKALVDRCFIKAPYDGRIIRLAVQPYENATVGQPILEIVGSQVIEIESAVPASVAIGMKLGSKFIFKNDTGDFAIPGHVVGIAPVIDPVSQLVSVRGIIDDKNTPIVIGITGTLEISQKQ